MIDKLGDMIQWESKLLPDHNYQLTGTLNITGSVIITRYVYGSEMIDLAKMEITRSIWSQFYGDIMGRLNQIERMAYLVPTPVGGRGMVEEIQELKAILAGLK